MKPSFILIVVLFLGIFPGEVLASPYQPSLSSRNERMLIGPGQNRPSKKQVKTKKADIKVVPKSRKQVKPTVVKSKVKVKPVKITRPKIKKP